MTTTDSTAVLARIRQMVDYWEQHLPDVIRTPAVVSAIRAALEPAAAVLPPADRAASTAPLAAGLPLVKGNCPACGTAGLFLGDGGYVTCSLIACPEPDAASTMLERRMAGETPATSPMTVYLSTPCDACNHTLNWHRNDVGCTVPLCVCGRFQEPAASARQDGSQP